MSNLIRFEFYNNFDIWYDLYQENGGDPNHIINIMILYTGKYMNIDAYSYSYESGYGHACGYEYFNEIGNEYGYGNGFGFEYGYKIGCGYGYGFGSGYEYEGIIGILFDYGNGSI